MNRIPFSGGDVEVCYSLTGSEPFFYLDVLARFRILVFWKCDVVSEGNFQNSPFRDSVKDPQRVSCFRRF